MAPIFNFSNFAAELVITPRAAGVWYVLASRHQYPVARMAARLRVDRVALWPLE